jgi:hypothetical protein
MNLIVEKIRRRDASEIHRGTGSNAGQRLQPGLRINASPLVALFSFGTYDKRRRPAYRPKDAALAANFAKLPVLSRRELRRFLGQLSISSMSRGPRSAANLPSHDEARRTSPSYWSCCPNGAFVLICWARCPN